MDLVRKSLRTIGLLATLISAGALVSCSAPQDLEISAVLGKPGLQSPDARLPNLALRLEFDQPNGRIVALQEDGKIVAWNLGDGQPSPIGETSGLFAYCAGANRLLEHDGTDLKLKDLTSDEATVVDTNAYHHAVWNADCTRFAAASRDENELRIWQISDLATYELLHTPTPLRNGIAMSRDGRHIATAQGTYSDAAGHKTYLEIISRADGGGFTRLSPNVPAQTIMGLWQMAFTPDNANLVVGTQNDGKSGIRSFRIADGLTNWSNKDFESQWVRAIAISPDGRLVATGDEKGWLRLWSVSSGEKLAEHQTGLMIQSASFSNDSNQLAVALLDSTIALIDVSNISK
jgi:WD40 repeat protein